ncbi:MAG: LacI family DNA-binding transcriptional regulator, partial [Thermoanaerobaculia bacterium]
FARWAYRHGEDARATPRTNLSDHAEDRNKLRRRSRNRSGAYTTVSRVLNGKEVVRPETLRQVQAAAKALHYVPNVAARSLSIQRSHVAHKSATNTNTRIARHPPFRACCPWLMVLTPRA